MSDKETKQINEIELFSGLGKWLKDRQRPNDTYYSDKVKSASDYISSFANKPAGSSTSDYQAAKSDNGGGEKASSVFQRMKTPGAQTPASSTPASSGSSTPKTSGNTTTNGSTGVEKASAGNNSATPKMSFSQAYAKARELAKSQNKDPNQAQFKWTGKDGVEKTFQSAAAKKDYIPMSKQFKVDVNANPGQKPQKTADGPPAPAPAKNPTANVPLPPARPNQGPPASAAPPSPGISSTSAGGSNIAPSGDTSNSITGPRTGSISNPPSASVTIKPESGKKKMSEEMNPLVAAFLRLQETRAGNVFEAAKKLSKKQDEKMDVVDDDKIDGKDLAALRAMKKEETEVAEGYGSKGKPGFGGSKGSVGRSYGSMNSNPNAPKATDDQIARTQALINTFKGPTTRAETPEEKAERTKKFSDPNRIGGKPTAFALEDVEQIDELKQSTVLSYAKTVQDQKFDGKVNPGHKNRYAGHKDGGKSPEDKQSTRVAMRTNAFRNLALNKAFNDEPTDRYSAHKLKTGDVPIGSMGGSQKAAVLATKKEEVEFSDNEIEHIAAILEGRPRKHPIESEDEAPTKNVAAQVRTTRSKFDDSGKETVTLKHPLTGKSHSIPVKHVNDFNEKYASASKAEHKNQILADFMGKHMSGH